MPAYDTHPRGVSKVDSERARRPKDVLEETEQQWIYTEEELLRTPSICDGLKPEEERTFRYKGHNFITQVGIMLKLPQTTLGTATVFFNRFLMRYSLKAKGKGEKLLHHYQIAATALFLATKAEEHCRKVKELVIACCRVAQKNPSLLVDENTKDYWRWRDTILHNEDVLLEQLCFDVSVESPYNILFSLLQHYRVDKHRKLRDSAWSFINDSHLTQACLLFSARTIACAAFYCGAKHTETKIPDNEASQPWWEAQHVRLLEIRRACNYMADFYTNAPNGLKPGSEGIYVGLRNSLESGDEGATSTRLMKAQTPNTPATLPMERSGSERSLKRDREEDVLDEGTALKENGNGMKETLAMNGNGVTTTLRIPAAAAQSRLAEGPDRNVKRLKVDDGSAAPPPAAGTNGIGAKAEKGASRNDMRDGSGSEEGEVEETNGAGLKPQWVETTTTQVEDAGSEEGEVEE